MLICLAKKSFTTSACSLEKSISLVPLARLTSGRCVCLRHFCPTLFNIQQSRFIFLQFAHCILSKALQIRWLIACGYNKYLEESRELKVIPPRNAFPLLTTSWWWFFVLWTWAFETIQCTFWVACNLAFFGFLRSAEFTVPNLASFSPSIHLGLDDVAVDSMSSPSCLRLHIKASKTDPFRKGIFLNIGRGEFPLCAIRSLLAYLTLRGNAPGPLFLFRDGRPLTRALLTSWLRDILSSAGIQGNLSSHSFRIGATTVAARNGIPDHQNQALGRWTSSAYLSYIPTPAESLSQLSKQLSRSAAR